MMKSKKEHTVLFELFGKNMKTKVLATSKDDAKQKVKDKIIFHKVDIDKDDYFNKSVDLLNKIKDILK